MNLYDRISPHLSFYEVIRSQTATRYGIDNTPQPEHLENVRNLALNVFEPLRALVSDERSKDTPLHISSFYRCAALNKRIGGSERSQHCHGMAVDIDVDGLYDDLANFDLFYIIEENLGFDQLIWEYGNEENPNWVHVSYNPANNRNQILKALREANGKVKYEIF